MYIHAHKQVLSKEVLANVVDACELAEFPVGARIVGESDEVCTHTQHIYTYIHIYIYIHVQFVGESDEVCTHTQHIYT